MDRILEYTLGNLLIVSGGFLAGMKTESLIADYGYSAAWLETAFEALFIVVLTTVGITMLHTGNKTND